jgi:hypothetical protein
MTHSDMAAPVAGLTVAFDGVVESSANRGLRNLNGEINDLSRPDSPQPTQSCQAAAPTWNSAR